MAALAMDTICHLPITSKGNRWVLRVVCLHMSDMLAIPMKEKSAQNVIQAYLFGILDHKGGNITMITDNGTECKNKVLNEV